ncbi:MAG: ATP-binding protein [Pseudomonadota bacterium]
MREFIRKYEAFLRLEEGGPASQLVRARTLYCFGWAFIFIQIPNHVGMFVTYGQWTRDHAIALGAQIVVLLLIHAMRYWKAFSVFALICTLLAVAATFASALPDGTGINSALLPMLVMMPVFIGFVAGPRQAVVSGILVLLSMIILHSVSYVTAFSVPDYYAPRNQQRALQAALTLIMVTAIAVPFSATIYRVLDELQQSLRRVKQAEAVKDQFLAAMSHELRTPLNGVIGVADVLEMTSLTSSQKDYVRTIKTSGERLLAMLVDVMDVSAIRNGTIELQQKMFRVEHFAARLEEQWKHEAEEKGLAFDVEIEGELNTWISADELRVSRIASHLISNAVKFTQVGDVLVKIKVSAERETNGWLEIAVRDTGPGISSRDQSRIFESFRQVEEGFSRQHDGAGMGLSISKSLTELMGGTLSVQSSLGTGATFKMRIPVAVRRRKATGSPKSKPEIKDEARPKPRHVLIVEDNAVNQMVAQKLLENMGAKCEVAVNGEEALDKLETATFDLVLCDKHMPVMDGLATLEAIRGLPDEKASLPVIACTADAVAGEEEKMLAAGFDVFITKPLSYSGLSAAIDQALSRGPTSKAA